MTDDDGQGVCHRLRDDGPETFKPRCERHDVGGIEPGMRILHLSHEDDVPLQAVRLDKAPHILHVTRFQFGTNEQQITIRPLPEQFRHMADQQHRIFPLA